jgi:hypothetical protein
MSCLGETSKRAVFRENQTENEPQDWTLTVFAMLPLLMARQEALEFPTHPAWAGFMGEWSPKKR